MALLYIGLDDRAIILTGFVYYVVPAQPKLQLLVRTSYSGILPQ